MEIFEELGVPKKYLKTTSKEGFFTALVHKLWLKSLVKYSKLSEFIERGRLDSWPSSDEELGNSWCKIFISVFKKRDVSVIPLPRIRSLIKDDSSLLFCQLMQYIHQTNYKNLWKEAYKKYNNKTENNKETQISLIKYNEVLKEIIIRIYGCPIINVNEPQLNIDSSKHFDVHLNILPAVCAVETLNTIFVLHLPVLEHNLKDCVTFSPAILTKSYSKPLFIIYQLLQTLKSMHDRSLTLGDISLSDIYLSEDMWVYIIPSISSNIYIQETKPERHIPITDCRKNGHKFDLNLKCESCGIKTYDRIQISCESLEELCQLWVDGQISNFTYLSVLNKLSGRKLGDPNCHHVFPWVTDFTSRCGKNWRDLKKSKYRINKGDRQLDLTFENPQSQIPHHVSDVLSSITYYVYMARRTPRSVLCKNVRTVWVPAEYPSSIQRLQEWTPDECIPEFFTDPTVFRSIHDDLDDLEVPVWASGPEDFIEKHREALESQHVSERLHHWIDLTFGYKLAGNAAIKAKNVCLHLVDDHEKLMKSGIVQLFTQPHPPKTTPLLFWNKTPPKIYITKSSKKRDRSSSPGITLEANDEDDEDGTNSTKSLNLSRFLSRSRSSLNEEPKPKNQTRSSSLGPKNPTFTSHINTKPKTGFIVPSSSMSNGVIYLPKEYKPELFLENLEKKHSFFSKTFHVEDKEINLDDKKIEEKTDDYLIQNAFTNLIFTENFQERIRYNQNRSNQKNSENQIVCNYSDIISSRRIRELQILGCLIVEIFMAKQLRALGANDSSLSFNERLKACLTVIRNCRYEIPSCISYIVDLLLQPETVNFKNFKYPSVTDLGLPPPSAHLLLEPLLHSVIPFSKLFPSLYSLISNLKDFKNVSMELGILYHFDCNGEMCTEYENLERTKILFAQNIGECKVKACSRNLEELLDNVSMADSEIITILLAHIRDLIEDPATSVLAAWYLFDPISRVLGPQKTSETLLDSILKLYENEPNEINLPYYGKIAKLYHHSFLLRLMVRLGLKCFLDNFTAPLVEAVGRYKDYEKVDFILHTHSEKLTKKTSHLKTMDTEPVDASSDDSSVSSEKRSTPNCQQVSEPEMFEFDDDKQNEEQLKSLMEHLELNVASDLPFNHSTAEEALDATITENLDQLRSLEELNMNLSEDDEIKSVVSPTIPIPTTKQEFSNISCEIGSKKSDSMDLVLESPSSQILETKKNVPKSKKQDAKISDMSADSLIWLSHRLGPVLTARYLSRNLLKMLTLCYVGKENLVVVTREENTKEFETISVVSNYVLGDHNATKVLECLTSIAGLYGEQLILFQYIPHMSELIALCKRKLTPNLEGGLISCLALLQHVIPYLSDSTLMDQLQDVILKNIIHPIVRLLSTTKYTFPSGSTARNILARKYIDTLYVLSIRMGSDMTRTHLAVPALQRFFLIFDKIYSNENNDDLLKTQIDTHYIEVCRDGTETEWSVGGSPIQITQKIQNSPNYNDDEQSLEELKAVFTPDLAYSAYLPFFKHVGVNSLEISLKNHNLIKELCQEYEQINLPNLKTPVESNSSCISSSSSIGSNIALIGNRIDVQTADLENINTDVLSLVSNRLENNSRHLRGNWLAYWEHEIGRSDKDTMFNFKQIKLQTFTGHTHSVKCLYVLDNENSFISGSRDKTVKLWSLRSQGDGSSCSNCQWTYTAHKKSVLSITFIESMRLVASCDSIVHIWDPFMGVNVGHLESAKFSPVNVLKSLPAPSSLVIAATTDGTIKLVDTRICNYIQELKVSLNPSGLIRCLAVSPSGVWIASGQSSGVITVLDSRTGLVISTWKAHESEVLQLIAADNFTLISSSLDQTISVWNIQDGKFKFYLRGATEPVHCLNVYNNELISGTTANRIGVHTSIDLEASFSSTKLRSDAFRGLLTSMALLPLNRLLLLGADTGVINLLC